MSICALAWSCGFLSAMPYFGVGDVAFLMMVFAGISAGAVITLSTRVQTYVTFTSLMLGPPTLMMLSSVSSDLRQIGAMACFFLIFCGTGVLKANVMARTVMLRRYQNQDYLHDLDAAKTELEAAWKRSEAANDAKRQFLANVSHELRTPLNGILGMAELLLEDDTGVEPQSKLHTLQRSGNHLARLVDDLLDFSRIEAGQMPVEAVEFELHELVEHLIEVHAVQARRKGGLDVRLEWAAGLPERVVGDPVRMRQVLHNLLGNAVKFTSEGEVSLRVWSNTAPSGERLVVQVCDTGIGIHEDRREAVFESFTQADGTTTRNFGGTGLGLAISAQLVELMGGGVSLESEVGAGSTFTVDLPLRTTAGRAGLPAAQVLIAGAFPGLREELEAFGWQAVECPFDGDLWQEARHLFREPGPIRGLLCHAQALQVNRGLVEALQRNSDCRVVVADSDGSATRIGRDEVLHWSAGEGAAALRPLLVGDEGTVSEESLAEPTRRLRVLVAEDDPTSAHLMRHHLESAGHEVRIAGDGEEAVRMCREFRPDLVLMDCQMPRLDGLEATRRIRAEFGPEMPILALSAHNRPEDRERFSRAGMDGLLTKPFDRRAVDAALREILLASPTAAPPRA